MEGLTRSHGPFLNLEEHWKCPVLASKVQGLGQLELWVVGAQNGAGKEVDWDSICLFLPPAPLCMCPAGWKLLAMLALVLVVMVWYSISREDRYIEL